LKEVDATKFYDALFAPLIQVYGPPDRDTITAIVGFDAGDRSRCAPLVATALRFVDAGTAVLERARWRH
jgi:hypothetical protein